MRFLAALILALVASQMVTAGAAQLVPEGVHSEGNGKAEVCGLTAPSVSELEHAIRARSDVERLDVTADYVAYATSSDGMRVLTFTMPSNRAHPAVACRQIVDDVAGGSTIQTSIACFNSRENCDWLYGQFDELTKRTISEMGKPK
jgi:hypothetical protein